MHNRLTFIALATTLTLLAGSARAQAPYVPSEGNLQSRKEFSQHRLGIFLHWGIYSTYAQGEWYLSTGHLDPETYSEAAAVRFATGTMEFEGQQYPALEVTVRV